MAQWLEIALRTLVAIIVLFFMTKLLGKRQVSELSLFEYITGITIGSLAAYVSLDLEANWYLGLVALGVWILVSLGIEYLQIKSKVMRNFIDGKGTVLIKEGKVMEDNLKKERIAIDEMMRMLRSKNAFKVSDVEFAVLEPNGDLNVMLAKENQPITPHHLGIKVGPEIEPQTIIMDGKILNEPLATLGYSRDWLNTELDKLGVALENVFVGEVDSYGQFYVDLYDDQIKVPKPQQRAVLLATLKKCEADLEMFALSSQDEKVKKMYELCSQNLQQVIGEIKPFLIR